MGRVVEAIPADDGGGDVEDPAGFTHRTTYPRSGLNGQDILVVRGRGENHWEGCGGGGGTDVRLPSPTPVWAIRFLPSTIGSERRGFEECGRRV